MITYDCRPGMDVADIGRQVIRFVERHGKCTVFVHAGKAHLRMQDDPRNCRDAGDEVGEFDARSRLPAICAALTEAIDSEDTRG